MKLFFNKKAICVIFFFFNILFASRFWAIISSDGTDFTTGFNYVRARSQFGTLVSQGYNTHEDGLGFAYYVNSTFGETVNWPDGGPHYPVWRVSESPNNDNYDINYIKAVMRYGGLLTPNDPTDGINCAIGHVRLASTGCGSEQGESNPPNPHPFIQTLPNGQTFSFAHNGTVDKDVLRALITDEWMDNNFQPQTFPDVGCGGDWHTDEGFAHVIDSELYFFWILKNIMEEETGDILRGIHNALSHQDFKWRDENQNMVLTNGSDIWSYRKTASNDNHQYPDNWHSIYWKYVDNPSYGYEYKTVMSQQDDTDDGWELLENGALVYLPRKGKPFIIEYFAFQPDIEQKMLTTGWNWVGFPILPDDNETSVANAFSRLTDLNDPFSFVDDISVNHESLLTDWSNTSWGGMSEYLIKSVDGYKIQITDNDFTWFNTPFSGTKIPADTPIELTEGENWINYFLSHSQHPSDAFPQYVLENMISIQAQDWFMTRRNGQFYVKQDCPPEAQGSENECFQLNYGEMVIVTMSEPEIFSWIFIENEDPPGPYESPTPRYFNYKEKGSYMPLVIESINNEIVELGAFNDLDECVGAEVVDGSPMNFKLYNNGLNHIRFEAITESGMGRLADNFDVANDYKPELITMNNSVHYISLNPYKREPKEKTKKENYSIQAYPNPFNSNVEINIFLEKDETITLEIFSITGQYITDIKRGTLKKGEHIFHWNGKNIDQNNVPNGIYFYRFSTSTKTIKGKLLYLK